MKMGLLFFFLFATQAVLAKKSCEVHFQLLTVDSSNPVFVQTQNQLKKLGWKLENYHLSFQNEEMKFSNKSPMKKQCDKFDSEATINEREACDLQIHKSFVELFFRKHANQNLYFGSYSYNTGKLNVRAWPNQNGCHSIQTDCNTRQILEKNIPMKTFDARVEGFLKSKKNRVHTKEMFGTIALIKEQLPGLMTLWAIQDSIQDKSFPKCR